MEEKYMGLLLIGRFLEGKPYESAMSRPKQRIKKEKSNLNANINRSASTSRFNRFFPFYLDCFYQSPHANS